MKLKTNMHTLASAFLGTIALISSFFGGVPHFGNVTLTSLSGSDHQNNFPTTYNANNTALNNGKMDVGTTSIASITTLSSLATVGTITSGVWQSTTIGAQYGGTGSTTLSANQVLLGNGTSLVKTVSGWGNSGQALCSNGGVLAPTWCSLSFDATQNYTFSGNNIFSASSNFTGTTRLKTLISSSTIQINDGGAGVSYIFPTSQGSTGTTLINNGSGTLTWGNPAPPQYTYASTSQSIAAANKSVTSATTTIPAGTLTGSSTITVSGIITSNPTGNNARALLEVRDNNANTYISQTTILSISNACNLYYTVKIMATSLTAQTTTLFGTMICGTGGGAVTNVFTSNTTSANWANALGIVVRLSENSGGSGSTATSEGFNLVANP